MAWIKLLNKQQNKKSGQAYFQTARSWSDDYYTVAVASKNRWRYFSLFILLPLLAVSLISISMLVPMQHIEPILINHYSDGVVSILPAKSSVRPVNTAEIESDMVRYVQNREAYDAFSYSTQYHLVLLLSANSVAKEYMDTQAQTNPAAPVNQLGHSGTKTVQIDSVLFLDNVDENNSTHFIHSHPNLAQINFSVTTTQNGNTTTVPYTALMGWQYEGTPVDPTAAWLDWNGFTVTHYQVQAQQAPNRK